MVSLFEFSFFSVYLTANKANFLAYLTLLGNVTRY